MRKQLVGLIALAVVLLSAGSAIPAELKVGVLDFQDVFQKYDGYEEAQRIFDKDMETWQASKQQMVDELLAARENLEVQRLMITPETQREKEAQFAQMEAELYQFEQETFGAQGTAVRRNMELSEPIYEKIREVVKTLAEEEGYDIVFDVTGAVLYARPELTLDDKVSAALKAKG